MSTVNAKFGRLTAGVGGALLLVSLFMPWSEGHNGNLSGWETLSLLRSSEGSAVDYSERRRPVRLSLNESADDGEKGEHDRVLSRGAAVTLLGGRGDDRLYAARNYRHSPRELNRVSLVGNGGADVLIGNSAANELFADRYAPAGQSRDPDRLYGRGGHDRLYGNAGPNLLDGGPGQDLVWAGRGDDVLRLRSHDLDGGSCGGGFDRIDVDVRDSLAQRAGCEHITRSSPAVETFDAFNGAAAGRELIADERRFNVDLTCPPDAARRCRGQVLMRYRSRVLARGSFSTRRGREDQIALHLTAAGRHKFIDQGAYIETVLEIRSRDRWGRPRATRAGGWISSLSLEV